MCSLFLWRIVINEANVRHSRWNVKLNHISAEIKMWPIINGDDDDGEDDKRDDNDVDDGDDDNDDAGNMSGKRENWMAKMPNEMFVEELQDPVYEHWIDKIIIQFAALLKLYCDRLFPIHSFIHPVVHTKRTNGMENRSGAFIAHTHRVEYNGCVRCYCCCICTTPGNKITDIILNFWI